MAVCIDVQKGASIISLAEQHFSSGAATAAEPVVPFVGSDIPAAAYRQIAEILRQQQNFTLDGYKDLCIKRRIAARIRAVGLSAPEPYLELLQESPEEQQQLLTALSVHVSQFFRNPSTFRVLETRVLPELASRAQEQNSKLRIWSVGCANGEEPYSLAILCRQLQLDEARLAIIGTDLSPLALQRAKQGSYEPNRLQEVSGELLDRFFTQQENRFRLCSSLRHRVRFFRHDILSDQPFYRADLILCRNLLIYFAREQQRRILQLLAAALPPGGYLVLGRAETLVPGCRDLFRCIDPAERIYQRLETDEQLLPSELVRQLQDFA